MQELLHFEVITPSQSHFLSPILFVRKVDESWRIFVNFRVLSQETINDKFLDLVVDELCGTKCII